MLIAVLSDIHDHLDNLQRVLSKVADAKAEHMLFLGDFCAPFTLAAMAEGFTGPIDTIFGNNDGDPFLLSRIAARHEHITLHGQLAELKIGSCFIGCNHYPDIGRRLAESGAYGAVFSGHDHKRYQHQIEKTLWANPGEIMGRFGVVSFGLFDTENLEFKHVEVE